MLILGIETSCDETGVALFDERQGLLAHALFSQIEMHADYGGVVPELASRDHVRKLLPLCDQVLADAGKVRADIEGIAYTAGPGLIGALMVGGSVAHALGFALGIPVLGVHHMEGHLLAPMLEDLKHCWQGDKGRSDGAWSMEPVNYSTREAWLTSTQVNFCAKAYPTVAVDHPDAGALTVLGGFLRNGYLHRAIREKGGAYGGGAGQDSVNGVFRFFSYRDPRFAETLDDFDAALDWLRTEDHDEQSLEEAILGVIGQLDRPRSPSGAARHAFHNNLFGRSPEQRARFRERVLGVTMDELRRVADTWLKPESASIAVVTSPDNRETAEQLGLSIQEL